MPFTYGYLCEPRFMPAVSMGVDDQLAAIQEFCDARGLTLGKVFRDSASAMEAAWNRRPAGVQLFASLGPEDSVVVASGHVIYSSAGVLLEIVQRWRRSGIVLHVAKVDFFGAGSDEQGMPLTCSGNVALSIEAALRAVVSLNRSSHGAARRAGIAAKRAQGLRHARFPGYGYRWEGKPGSERRVEDAGEMALADQILAWVEQGHSYEHVALHLLRNHVKTADKRDWSASRVRRVYYDAVRRRDAAVDRAATTPVIVDEREGNQS